MALPANTKTWQIDPSILVAQEAGGADDTAKAMWLALKNSLIGFSTLPWIVDYSCDSITAGTPGDNVDRWTDISDIVTKTADTARSWMVLRNPTTGMELLFDMRVSATTSNRNFRLMASYAAGFTGGTTSAKPTATDQEFVLTGVSNASCSGLGGGANTTNRDYRLHVWHSDDGEITYWVINFNNNATSFAAFGKPDQPVAGWTTPLIIAWTADDADPPILGCTYECLWDVDLVTHTSHERFQGNFPSSGNAAFRCSGEGSGDGSTQTGGPVGRLTPSTNEISGEHMAPAVGIHCHIAGDKGSHGRFFDLRWAGDENSTGDTHPAAGGRTHVVMGNLLLPWDGSVPLVS